MSLNINQFAQSPVQGMLDLLKNQSTISARISSTSSGGLVAGQSVKIVAATGVDVPSVVECADDSDDIFGFINYDIKSATFEVGDLVELSFFQGNVMYMTASAAITQWADVMVVIASKKVATATAANRIAGKALDGASADGDLIRVLINLPGALAS